MNDDSKVRRIVTQQGPKTFEFDGHEKKVDYDLVQSLTGRPPPTQAEIEATCPVSDARDECPSCGAPVDPSTGDFKVVAQEDDNE
jgi:hypothetical protein